MSTTCESRYLPREGYGIHCASRHTEEPALRSKAQADEWLQEQTATLAALQSVLTMSVPLWTLLWRPHSKQNYLHNPMDPVYCLPGTALSHSPNTHPQNRWTPCTIHKLPHLRNEGAYEDNYSTLIRNGPGIVRSFCVLQLLQTVCNSSFSNLSMKNWLWLCKPHYTKMIFISPNI